MIANSLIERLDSMVALRHLLQHPFYQDWQAGKLSRASLQLYAAQYYRHVEAFPQHLRVLAGRAISLALTLDGQYCAQCPPGTVVGKRYSRLPNA